MKAVIFVFLGKLLKCTVSPKTGHIQFIGIGKWESVKNDTVYKAPR